VELKGAGVPEFLVQFATANAGDLAVGKLQAAIPHQQFCGWKAHAVSIKNISSCQQFFHDCIIPKQLCGSS
jgi:hypothetical protein